MDEEFRYNEKFGPCCGVFACAFLGGVHLDDAMAALRKIAEKPARWKGRTVWRDREALLALYRVRYEDHTDLYRKSKRCTLRTFVDDIAHTGAFYLVSTTRHTQVVKGRMVLDQGGCFKIESFWGRNKRVTAVYKITKLGRGWEK